MGKIKSVVGAIGSMFGAPDIPKPPPPPPPPGPPAEMPDPDSSLAAAAARRKAASRRSTGRQSTILSDGMGSGSGVLGV